MERWMAALAAAATVFLFDPPWAMQQIDFGLHAIGVR
jgi:hypothetical protein